MGHFALHLSSVRHSSVSTSTVVYVVAHKLVDLNVRALPGDELDQRNFRSDIQKGTFL